MLLRKVTRGAARHLDAWVYYAPLGGGVFQVLCAVGGTLLCVLAATGQPWFAWVIGAVFYLAGVNMLWLSMRYADELWPWWHDRQVLAGRAGPVRMLPDRPAVMQAKFAALDDGRLVS